MKLKQMSTFQAAQILVQAGELKALELLLEQQPTLVHWQNPADLNGLHPSLLHYATGWEEKSWSENAAGVVKILLEYGLDIDIKNRETLGETALHWAVSINNVEVCKTLLEKGANPELKGKFQNDIDTALGYALFYGTDETLEQFRVNCPTLLLRYGAKVFLPFAAALNEMVWVKRCFSPNGSLNPSAGPGHPTLILSQALLFACRYGNIEICDYLLYRGANINVQIPFFDHHASALHIACEQGQQTELVHYLLKKGADPSRKDLIFDANALGWSMFYGQDEVFRILHKFQ